MKRVYSFAEEGKWTSGADSTMLMGEWQAWVDGDGHWKVRGPDRDNEAHYADCDIELTAAEDEEAGNSAARRKIRARRAKETARAYIKSMLRSAPSRHAREKSPAQLQREIDEVLRKPRRTHSTISTSSAYEQAKAESERLDKEASEAGEALRAFPRGPTGITPDSIRATPAFREAKARYDKAFAKQRAFNGPFVKRFAKELREERRLRDQARQRRSPAT
jgi:hypothetical protein